jgi:hypothetical protein
MMTQNIKLIVGLVGALLLFIVGALLYSPKQSPDTLFDATPQQVVLSGTYVCLPHLDTSGPQTEECAFGLEGDDGNYYAVNFGASADSMAQFQSGAHIRAEGFVVAKEALSASQWQQYNMKGIFTITAILESTPDSGSSGKINIDAVCEGALAYMSFPDGASAEEFVAACKNGEHPEVIEQYKAQMGLGDGAAI